MSQVAEGVKTTKSAHDLAERLGVEMPITMAMYHLIYTNATANSSIVRLCA